MPGPTLTELRRMPKDQLNKINKTDIIEIILAGSGDDDSAIDRVEARLATLVTEIAALVKSFADYKEDHDKKLQDMQAKIDKQSDIIMKQQMFLENNDRKERENNIVALGVLEETDEVEGATDDNAKL